MADDLHSIPSLGQVPRQYFTGGQAITDGRLPTILNNMSNATRAHHAAIVTASAASSAPGQQPTIITSGALILLGFTLGTDDAFRQFKIPYSYAGNASVHLHWSKTTDVDEQGKAARWRVSYKVFESTVDIAGEGDGSPSTVEVEDTYDASDTTARKVYRTTDVPLTGFVAGHYISMKVEAVTPAGTALAAEPGLFSLDLIFDEYINK